MDYVRDTMDWLMGKGRRKADKEPPSSDGTPGPPYLDPARAKFPTQFVTPALLPAYVRLPLGVDRDEWLATHTISFFEHVNLLYSCLSEYCNDCSSMNGPQQSQYLWVDEKGKKTKSPAACYVDFVMTFVHKLITDESVFPTKYGNTFPPNFLALVKRAWRYLFHVIAHIYAAHFLQIFSLQLHSHLHTLFVHFSVFNKEFGLVEEEETRVLDDLLDLLLSQGMCGSAGSLPPLTTSQSDGALHNRTRIDSSPCDGAGGDAWSLPPGGVTSTPTLFPDAAASSPLAASAPAQFIVDAARNAGGVARDADDDDDDNASHLGAASAALDDSFETRLLASSTHRQIGDDQRKERVGNGDDDNGEGAELVEEERLFPSDRQSILPNDFRTSPSPPPPPAFSSTSDMMDSPPPHPPSILPPNTAAIVNDDDDQTMTPIATSNSPLKFSPANAPHHAFATHRVQGQSYSSGTSDASNEKSRSSSGHSNLSAGGGGGGAAATNVVAPVAASSSSAISESPFALLSSSSGVDGEKEDDKENLSPMGDLSTSAEGATMMVENMEVTVAELSGTDDDCRR